MLVVNTAVFFMCYTPDIIFLSENKGADIQSRHPLWVNASKFAIPDLRTSQPNKVQRQKYAKFQAIRVTVPVASTSQSFYWNHIRRIRDWICTYRRTVVTYT
jgi:hypothetical protein